MKFVESENEGRRSQLTGLEIGLQWLKGDQSLLQVKLSAAVAGPFWLIIGTSMAVSASTQSRLKVNTIRYAPILAGVLPTPGLCKSKTLVA